MTFEYKFIRQERLWSEVINIKALTKGYRMGKSRTDHECEQQPQKVYTHFIHRPSRYFTLNRKCPHLIFGKHEQISTIRSNFIKTVPGYPRLTFASGKITHSGVSADCEGQPSLGQHTHTGRQEQHGSIKYSPTCQEHACNPRRGEQSEPFLPPLPPRLP